ncbi:WXG100 family type VII secretion target [Streptomyces sp. 8N616]|uniref:WXG100 family type VII secretion target n=1 Tax=Streptomyces sp. 8N616 TaxID=3457414 RepID=UPI003FD3431B
MSYAVKFSEVAAVIAEMGKSTNTIEEMIHNLETQVEKSLQEWEGGAREMYREKKAEWDSAAVQMKQKLSEATHTLQQIVDTYDISEKQAQKMWSQQGIK